MIEGPQAPGSVVAETIPAQRFALASGVLYVIFGVVGFAATGFSDFTSEGGHQLLVFGINPLHNLVHLAAGALWLWAARRQGTASAVNTALGVTFSAVAVLGLVGIASALALEPGDSGNFLHLATAALSLYFGTVGAVSVERDPKGSSTALPE
jgi:uncharacterized protein DUF4383